MLRWFMIDEFEVTNGEEDRMVGKSELCETVNELLADGVMERSKNCLANCFGGKAELMIGDTPRVRVTGPCKMLGVRLKAKR